MSYSPETYHEGDVIDLDVVKRPLSEEFDFSSRFSHPSSMWSTLR